MNRLKKSTLFYKLYRQNILSKVNSQNYSQAKTQLDNIVNQHDVYLSKIVVSLPEDGVVNIDNRSLHHAKDHLDTVVIFPNLQNQKQSVISALGEV